MSEARRFILMSYPDDGGWPTVTTVETANEQDVLAEARALLEAGACDRLEFWANGQLLHCLKAPIWLEE